MRRTIERLIQNIIGAEDADSVTRRIRASIARYRSLQPASSRGLLGDVADTLSRRHSTRVLRQIGLRKHRR